MNYEQKYHEALERAKKMRDSIIGSHNPESAKLHVGHIENIFPELRESKDERIRKELWEYFHNLQLSSDCDFSPSFTIDDVLAYLEKLKENPKSADSIPSDLVPDAKLANKILTDAIVALSNTVDYNCSEPLIYKKEIDNIKFLREEIEKQKEQKPAEWCGEDEHCIELLDTIIDSSALIPKNRTKCHNFLKSLRPQPKEDKFQEAMRMADKFEEGYEAGVYDTKAKAWKPSEEQMDALMKAITWLVEAGNHTDSSILANLRSHLNKLM